MDRTNLTICGGIAASLLGIPYIYFFTDTGLAWAVALAMPSTACFAIAGILYKLERKGKVEIVYRRRLYGRN